MKTYSLIKFEGCTIFKVHGGSGRLQTAYTIFCQNQYKMFPISIFFFFSMRVIVKCLDFNLKYCACIFIQMHFKCTLIKSLYTGKKDTICSI